MDERLEGLFQESLGRAQARYGLELTPRAIDLLRLTIDSLRDEPDARWPHDLRGEPERLQERAILRLPELLHWARRAHGAELINTFLLLQIAPRVIEAFCIWEKPPV